MKTLHQAKKLKILTWQSITMPPELRRAHQLNDKAVMEAYGFWDKINTESECVAELMKMYQKLTSK